MPYYLRHYFSPDFNYEALRPLAMIDGTVDPHFLGYVHNVVAGQVLAELEPLSDEQTEAILQPQPAPSQGDVPDLDPEGPTYDPRYVYQQRVFPLGPNCMVDPKNPNRILAAVNGFCFYRNGFITVKRLLNVRRDINFRTGNILFTGDVVVHGDVCPGFSLWGDTVLIKGRVEGGSVTARGRVDCNAGIKGAPTACIDAGKAVHLSFCESATIKTRHSLIIEGNCLHSTLYVAGSLVVKGRLQGGTVHANGLVYVKDQLGGGQGANTIINLGYDPFHYLQLEKLSDIISEQQKQISYYENRVAMNQLRAQRLAPLLEMAYIKLDIARSARAKLSKNFRDDERHMHRCRVVAPGTVHPGVEISIGQAYEKVMDCINDVFFYKAEDKIVQGFPALSNVHHLSEPPAGAEQ